MLDRERCHACGSWEAECTSDVPINGCGCSRCACAELAECKIKISKLESEIRDKVNDFIRAIGDINLREEKLKKEIAALQEAVRRTYHLQRDGTITVTECDGCCECGADLDNIEEEVRRAMGDNYIDVVNARRKTS